MDKFLLVFVRIASLILVMVSPAFAQTCMPAPYRMGEIQRCYDGRPLSHVQQQVVVMPFQQYPVQRPAQIPPNCRLVEKTLWQRVSGGVQNALLDGAVGALFGAAVDGAQGTGGRWTNVGLNAGAGLGLLQGSSDHLTMVCQEIGEGQRSLAAPQGGQVTAVPSDCDIQGVPELQNLRGLTQQQCAAIAARLKVAVPVQATATPAPVQEQKTFGNTPTAVNGYTCAVLNSRGEVVADFLDANKNPKNIVVKSGPQCKQERELFAQR